MFTGVAHQGQARVASPHHAGGPEALPAQPRVVAGAHLSAGPWSGTGKTRARPRAGCPAEWRCLNCAGRRATKAIVMAVEILNRPPKSKTTRWEVYSGSDA